MRSGSSAWLEYRLVTPGVASSNLVHSAILIILTIFLGSCSVWTPEDYHWKSDYFKKRYAVAEEVLVEPVEKPHPICSDCICNMDLCT